MAAQSGFDVVVQDIKQDFLERGKAIIAKNWAKLREKGKLTDILC